MAIDILKAIQNSKNDSDNGASTTSERFAYDPKGNTHCFNYGASPAWWTNIAERRGGSDGILKEFTNDPTVLMKRANGYFNIRRALCGSQFEDGTFLAGTPRSYNLHRADDLDIILQKDVGGDYSTKPYYEICVIPDEVTISMDNFSDNELAKDELQKLFPDVDVRDENVEIPVNKLLTPWSCSVWNEGRAITFQYLIGELDIKGDKYRKFLTIRSRTDGKRATDYFVTLVRVVCENTEFHADVEGWQSLMNYQKTRQRIRRNANMDEKITNWQETMAGAIIGLAEVSQIFTKLAEKKLTSVISEREEFVKNFVVSAFDLKTEGKTKRTDNRLNDALSAVYSHELGAGNCETALDLLHGLTAYQQHFTQINGKGFSIAEKEEKRYMNLLINDASVKQNQQVFQQVFNLIAA